MSVISIKEKGMLKMTMNVRKYFVWSAEKVMILAHTIVN